MEAKEKGERLKFFPITFFASVMGLSGLVIVFQRANEIFGSSFSEIINLLAYLVTLWFVFLTSTYLLKILRYPQEVKKEFNHPVKIVFIPTYSISLLLLSIIYLNINLTLSYIFWSLGAVIHLILVFYVLHKWFFNEFKIATKNPAWFIPVVGNILVPIVGVKFSQEISWFYFSIGLTFWLPILTILLYRLIFVEPLPTRLLPTLCIFLAPPAVAFISYVKLVGNIDILAKTLYYFSFFIFLLIVSFIPKFIMLPFYLSWWAYTFPMAAFTIATLLYYKETSLPFFYYFSQFLVGLTSFIVLWVAFKTLQAVFKHEICVEE